MAPRIRRALITGGSRGIGWASAIKLASDGVEVIINYLRNEEAAVKTAEEIRAKGGVVHLIKANVGNPDAIKSMFEEIRSRFLDLDIFVHCAAIGAFKPLTKITSSNWDLTHDVNVKAFFICAKEFAAFRKTDHSRVIIGMSSLGSSRFVPNYGAIGVSKAAVESLTKYLAAELAEKGIRVNTVSGGPIETDALRAFPDYERIKEESIRRTQLHRLGNAEDIADVVLFLCSDNSRWVCGQTIVVDGGFSLSL